MLFFCVYLDGGAKIFVSRFFLDFEPVARRFSRCRRWCCGVSCFSALIVATSGGNGLQQQQQQLFFCAVNLSWFFIMGSLHGFWKVIGGGSAATSNNRAASKHKKPLQTRSRFFLEKIAPSMPQHQTTARTKTAKHTLGNYWFSRKGLQNLEKSKLNYVLLWFYGLLCGNTRHLSLK